MDLYNGVTGYLHLIDILQEGLDLQGGEYNFYIFVFSVMWCKRSLGFDKLLW